MTTAAAHAERLRLPAADGVVLAADAWGPADGRAVLLLHGAGQTRHSWKGTGATLGAAGYRAIAVDARGHGDSTWAADGDYTVEAMVRDLVALTDASPDPAPVFVGASMGGGNALVVVGEGRVRSSGLVLVDVAPQTEVDGATRVMHFLRDHLDGFATLDDAADTIAAYNPGRPRPRRLDGLAKNLRQADDGRWYWHWDPAFVSRRRDLDAMATRRRDAAGRLTGPTLLVRGARSDVLSSEGAQDFLRLCPHSEFVDIPRAAHMVTGDRNDAFGVAAVEFLHRRVGAHR